MNREKLHEILDLVLDLNEQGATHATVYFLGHTANVSTIVWEGEEYDESTVLQHDRVYYDGDLYREEKLNNFIQELEELRDNI